MDTLDTKTRQFSISFKAIKLCCETCKSGSDIDLTIKATTLDLTKLLQIENELDDLLLPYKIDLSIMSQIDNHKLLEHIKRIGISFYKKS